MRPPYVLVGSVLVVVGLLVTVEASVLSSLPHSEQLAAGSEWTITPTTLTEETAHVSWAGAMNYSRIFVSYVQPDCAIPKGIVATGNGEQGALRVTLEPSITYFLWACFLGPTTPGQPPPTVSFTLTLTGGLSIVEVVALMMVVLGLVLVVVGVRRRGYRLRR